MLNIINLFNSFLDKITLLRYKKKFKNYQSAKEFCETHTKSSYNNELLNKFRLDKFKDNQKLIPYTFNNSLFALLESVSIFILKHQRLPKILDFGGMFAENKLYLEKLYNLNITYDVVETKNICDLAKTFNHCSFYDDIDKAFSNVNEKYDLIFSSGTIQYFENPYEIVKKIFSKQVRYIVFTRTNLSDDEGNYSAVSFLSGHGSSEGHIKYKVKNNKKIVIVPNTQMKEKKILEIAINNGYRLLRSFNGLTGNYGENSYTKDLIFDLKTTS